MVPKDFYELIIFFLIEKYMVKRNYTVNYSYTVPVSWGAKTEKTDSKRAMYRTRSSFFSSVVDPE